MNIAAIIMHNMTNDELRNYFHEVLLAVVISASLRDCTQCDYAQVRFGDTF